MRRLHLRLYLAIVLALLAFMLCTMLLVHGASHFLSMRVGAILTSAHLLLVLAVVAAGLAMTAWPVARGITARLGRLEQGVRRFGAGDLAARVAVEGRDEVAALAASFNESAGRVEQLVRANRQLLANCSHELRTPLARMRLAIERRADDVAASDAELRRNIAELDTLIGELLLSSRLDAAIRPPHVETLDLLALVAEEAAHFDLEVDGDAVSMSGDATLLRRLVRNLLQNAATHAGGATGVGVHAAGSQIHVVVEDAGPGIAPEHGEKIFEPFYRPPGAAAGGSGLGLSIVRQIARLHGGDAQHEARNGGGSRFIVTLPVRREATSL
jgi:signal transduction histidine kinase